MLALPQSTATKTSDFKSHSAPELIANTPAILEDTEETIPALKDVFSSAIAIPEAEFDESFAATEMLEEKQNNIESGETLEEIFTNAPELLDESPTDAEVLEETKNVEPDEVLEEIFALAPEVLAESFADADLSEDTRGLEPDEALEESSANAPESLAGNPFVAEVLEDTQSLEGYEPLEVLFANAAELLDESPIVEVPEDTEALAPEDTLEEIFAHAPDLLDENSPDFEVLKNTNNSKRDEALEERSTNAVEAPEDRQGVEAGEMLEEIFADAPELLDENLTGTQASNVTQSLAGDGVLEEGSSKVPEDLFMAMNNQQ